MRVRINAPAGVRSALRWSALAAVLSLGGPAFATEWSDQLAFEFIPPAATPRGGTAEGAWMLFMQGRIDDGAADRLQDELSQRRIESANVFLNSPGGSLAEGTRLGRLIRQHRFSTYVGTHRDGAAEPMPGICFSACVFAYIGGYYRFSLAQSQLGVHRFSAAPGAEVTVDAIQIVSAAVVSYIREMGVDVGLFDRMSQAGKDQIAILSKSDMNTLLVSNNGRLPARWDIEAAGSGSVLAGVQQTWQGNGQVFFSCNGGDVTFRARFEAGDYAEQLVSDAVGHAMRIGSATVPLADPRDGLNADQGYVSGEFVLAPDHLGRLRTASSVGYVAELRSLGKFSGFAVDAGGSAGDRIRGFLAGCER